MESIEEKFQRLLAFVRNKKKGRQSTGQHHTPFEGEEYLEEIPESEDYTEEVDMQKISPTYFCDECGKHIYDDNEEFLVRFGEFIVCSDCTNDSIDPPSSIVVPGPDSNN